MKLQKYKTQVFVSGFALIFAVTQVLAADRAPAELAPLIPAGTTLLTYGEEDLNGDGRKDYVFIVEKQANPAKKGEDDEGARVLLIAIRQGDNSLIVVKRNDLVVFCKQCGGAFGDPFDGGLVTKPKFFSVSHYGGSAWRWTNAFSFAYSRKDDTWQLVKVEESSFHASEPDKIKSKTYKPPRDFGKIDIADFDPDKFKGIGPK